MKTIFYLITIFFCTYFSNGQTKIIDCNTNMPVKNAIITNTQTREWIGNSDTNGFIKIPSKVNSVTIIHPNFGEIVKELPNNEICLDKNTEILDELIIDLNAKNELLEIIDKSYKIYKKNNKGKKHYSINHSLSSKLNGMLETFEGVVSLGSFVSTTLNNYKLNWTPAIIENSSYKKLSSVEYFSYLTEYVFFYNKYRYRNFRDYVNTHDVTKMGNRYYIYKGNNDHYFVIEVDLAQKLISKYTNTEIDGSFHRKSKNSKFGVNDKTLAANLKVEFNLSKAYNIKEMNVNEVYLVDGEMFYMNSTINSLNLTKSEIKKLKGKGIIGFVTDYIKQQQSFYEDHK